MIDVLKDDAGRTFARLLALCSIIVMGCADDALPTESRTDEGTAGASLSVVEFTADAGMSVQDAIDRILPLLEESYGTPGLREALVRLAADLDADDGAASAGSVARAEALIRAGPLHEPGIAADLDAIGLALDAAQRAIGPR